MNWILSGWEFIVVHVLSATLGSLAALALVRSTRTRAPVSYWIWVATSVGFLIPVAFIVRALAARLSAGAAATDPDWVFSIPAPSPAVHMWLFATWALGFGCAMGALLARCRVVWKLSRDIARDDNALDRRVIAGRLVLIRASAVLEAPAVVGFFRQTIVVPARLVRVLSKGEMDAIILHETAHVRRFDNLIELLHAVVCCLFWFHPLVWMVGTRLRESRELAADEPVIAAGLAGNLLSGISRLAGVRDTGSLMATITAEWRMRLAHLAGESKTSASHTIGTVAALALAWVIGITGATRISIFTPSAALQPHSFAPLPEAVRSETVAAPVGGIHGGVSGAVTGGPSGGVAGGVLGGVR